MEQPVRGLMSLFHQKDISVLIAINEKGVFVIDHVESVSVIILILELLSFFVCFFCNYFDLFLLLLVKTLLLGLRYEELSWDYAKPSSADDPDCLPCIFIQVCFGFLLYFSQDKI